LVLEQSSEALMITDADNRIVEINPAFTAVTGYGREEALGATPSLLKSGHQGPEFYRQMWSALNADGQWQGEIVNRNKGGELFAEWLSISTLFADNGAVHRRVALFSNVTEKKKRDELIWRQANFDMLTELPNRRMFHDRLRQEMLKTQRSGLKLVLLFLDLDRFKHVNDTLGHDKGDALLQQVARRISACVRESDTVARIGGDEFTVILTNIESMDSVERVASDIIHALSQPFDFGADVAHISASIGIAQYPLDTSDVAQLLNMADQAMYAAKNAGRSRFVHYAATQVRPLV
jgi:diguanylate cyclase (GGDEF)-like protein/PAS domain S-box-containing protein